MNSPVHGWWPRAVVAAGTVSLMFVLACQQQSEKPSEATGGQKAASPTAQMPQNMLDALHGKTGETPSLQPQGPMPAPGQTVPPQGMAAPSMQGVPQQGMQGMPNKGVQGMPKGMKGMPMRLGAVPKKIVVPAQVKNGWKAVVLEMTETGGASKSYEIAVNGGMAVPGSGLTLKVVSFLPDFKMTAEGFTSSSNEPKNPAAKVVVVEKGKTIFEGWLFKLHPDVHPFQHPKYRLTLKNGVAA
ncbi:MAG: hypothetical protein V2A77_00355 [Pseudomonadota bacterium]